MEGFLKVSKKMFQERKYSSSLEPIYKKVKNWFSFNYLETVVKKKHSKTFPIPLYKKDLCARFQKKTFQEHTYIIKLS